MVLTHLIDWVVSGMINRSSDLSDETKKILDKIGDSLTKIAVITFPESIKEKNENPYKNESLTTEKFDLGWKKTGPGFADWKKGKLKLNTHQVSKKFTTSMVPQGDFTGDKYGFFFSVLHESMRHRFLFNLEDSLEYFDSDEQASAALTELQTNEGQALPKSYNTNFTMDTDDSFARIFFQGIGCPLIARQEKVSDSEYGPHVVDMPLQKLATRSLYKEYGCRIHFDENQKVTAIFDYVENKLTRPGEEGWPEAKMHAKVTAFTLCTVREHLMWTHLIVSNDASRESILNFPPSHPIRRLLQIFTFHANDVNAEAFETLVPRRSLLHRSVALKYSSMEEVFDMAYTESIAYEPFPDRKINAAVQKMVDAGNFAYVSEGIEYYQIVRTFVREWLEKAGVAARDDQAAAFYNAMRKSSKGQAYELPSLDAPDAMVNLLSTIIFAVTAFHELIGHVVDYTCLPSRAGFRIAKNSVKGCDQTQIDIQSFFNAVLIAASTSVKMPKLVSDFPNYIGKGGAPDWEVEVWGSFQNALKAQSKKVQEADANRSVEFKYFDPDTFECSVSL